MINDKSHRICVHTTYINTGGEFAVSIRRYCPLATCMYIYRQLAIVCVHYGVSYKTQFIYKNMQVLCTTSGVITSQELSLLWSIRQRLRNLNDFKVLKGTEWYILNYKFLVLFFLKSYFKSF